MVLHNPNNWHWVDKNCLSWAREHFGKELVGLKAADSDIEVSVSKVKSVEGDVEVCQRKGKVISLFDIVIDLAWEGKVGESEVRGEIKIPEVSYDNDEDDYQFQITIDNDSSEKRPAKALVRQKVVPQLRKKLAAFGPTLIETHGGEIQHTGNEPIHWSSSNKPGSSVTQSKESTSSSSGSDQKYFGVSAYNTTSITVKPVFNASPEQLYSTLMTTQLVAIWSRSAPSLEPKVGGQFSLFGGNVSGKFVELDENKKIKLEWRLRDWKAGHHAIVTHSFIVGNGETTMETLWEGVPIGQEETVKENFNEYYVKPIKATFGFGLL